MAKRKTTTNSGMKPRDVKYVINTIENEGFDYAFTGYSDFEEIEGEEFHKLRTEFLAARKALADYLGLEDA